jgi:hypothetical protein
MGHPTNLCPETLTLPIGFLKDTLGAYRRYIHMYQEIVPLSIRLKHLMSGVTWKITFLTNGIISPKRAPSQ